MSFSTLLTSLCATGTGYQADVDASWAQGRATFGGVVAGIGNAVLRRLVPADRPLRSLQTTFIGPAAPGCWQITADVLRIGKAVTVARCEISESDRVAATLVGVYGGARASAVHVPLNAVTAVRSVDQVEIPDMRSAPSFTRHFDFRWAQAQPLFSAAPDATTQCYIRHREAQSLDESHVVALVDCIPSPALAMFQSPAPASSLTWTLEFIEHDFAFAPDAWWRIDTSVDAAAEGYVHQTGVLHAPDGRAVALTRQLVAVFG